MEGPRRMLLISVILLILADIHRIRAGICGTDTANEETQRSTEQMYLLFASSNQGTTRKQT